MLFMLSQLLHEGRCQRMPTQFAAHPLHTRMQLNMSEGKDSLAKMAMRISGGRRPIGGRYRSVSWWGWASRVATPTDDCESFAWAVKKSVSSSAVRSGDVDEVEDSEGASLENRAGCLWRGIRTAVGMGIKCAGTEPWSCSVASWFRSPWIWKADRHGMCLIDCRHTQRESE